MLNKKAHRRAKYAKIGISKMGLKKAATPRVIKMPLAGTAKDSLRAMGFCRRIKSSVNRKACRRPAQFAENLKIIVMRKKRSCVRSERRLFKWKGVPEISHLKISRPITCERIIHQAFYRQSPHAQTRAIFQYPHAV